MPRSRLVPVLLAAVLMVGVANLGAVAATGAPLLIGKGNKATKTTKLKTTGKGAALSLKSKAGAAPLAVSNSTKVTKLNADLVDGLESSALQNKSYVYNLSATGLTNDFAVFTLTGLPPGKYIANYSVYAAIPGADTSTVMGCYLLTGADVGATVAVGALGVATSGGSPYQVSGGGYLDNTAATYRFTCARSGAGSSMTIPAAPQYPARLVLTRTDDVSSADLVGANSPAFRDSTPLP